MTMKKEEAGRTKEIPFSWVLRSRFATKSSIDALFRLFGAKMVLPDLFYIRPLLMGSNFLDVREAFARTHSWEEWVRSWERLGEKRETWAKLAFSDGRNVTARENWIYASAAYFMAQFLLYDEAERKREIYGKCAASFRRAAPLLTPPSERVEIEYEGVLLPGYLRLPEGTERSPVLILFCGADSAKEEMHFFAEGLALRGIGTLAFDGPGIGETWAAMELKREVEHVGRRLFAFLRADRRVDPARIGLLGVSFGGNLALRVAAYLEETAVVVALSAPYDLSGYGDYVLPVIQEQVKYLLHSTEESVYRSWADGFSVRGLVEKIGAPLLVIGGGEDLLIPGDDTKRIFEEARGSKRMIFFEEANHLCTEYAYDLIGRIEEWLIETGFASLDPDRAAPAR